MQMAMMHGMMGMAMMQQMGQMGMMPPGYLHSLAAQQAQMMIGKDSKSRRRRRKSSRAKHAGEAHEGAGGQSSSSSSDSSSDSEDTAGVLPTPSAMAAMAAMYGPPGAASPNGAPVEDVEAFLAANPVDPEAADRLRALPPHLQQAVVQRGPVADTRNPSAVLITRVRDAELQRGGGVPATGSSSPAVVGAPLAPAGVDPEFGAGAYAGRQGSPPKPARRSAKVTIESMIRDFRLSPGCAWMLRALPPDKQKMAARIDPTGQADPSGYVAEQLKKIV